MQEKEREREKERLGKLFLNLFFEVVKRELPCFKKEKEEKKRVS